LIVGLTGGIGSGKSTVCKMFAKHGVPIISADAIAHELLKTHHEVFQAVKNKFGDEYIDDTSSIDRKKLRKTVFSHPEERLWLEDLLHPLIKEEIIEHTKNIVYPYCIVEIPLLVEVHWQELVDRVLLIDCTEEMQRKRAASRDQEIEEEIEHIIANQITREERRAASNDIIDNAGDMLNLQKHVDQMHKRYIELAASH